MGRRLRSAAVRGGVIFSFRRETKRGSVIGPPLALTVIAKRSCATRSLVRKDPTPTT